MEFYRAKYSDKKSGKPKSNKSRFDRDSKSEHRSFRNSNRYDSRPERKAMFDVTCDDCGVECQIPFEPKFNKPVYCSRCYEINEPKKSKRSRNDSQERHSRNDSRETHSRDDRPRPRYSHDNYGDRYSRNERSRERYREENTRSFDDAPKKLKNKSQIRQDKFFAGGSDKFYASIKEKLFEILGGKICSSCGFRDERALGFAHAYDGDTFDQIRRGGFASSWGKYISDPGLAREELRVLCLNCNEIREPPRKTQSEKPKKKSRYFPR